MNDNFQTVPFDECLSSFEEWSYIGGDATNPNKNLWLLNMINITERKGIALYDDMGKIKNLYNIFNNMLAHEANRTYYEDKLLYPFDIEVSLSDEIVLTYDLKDLGLSCIEEIKNMNIVIPIHNVIPKTKEDEEKLKQYYDASGWDGAVNVDNIEYYGINICPIKNKEVQPAIIMNNYYDGQGNPIIAKHAGHSNTRDGYKVIAINGAIPKRAFYVFFFHEFNHLYEKMRILIQRMIKKGGPVLASSNTLRMEITKSPHYQIMLPIANLLYFIFTESERLALLSEIIPDMLYYGNGKEFYEKSSYSLKIQEIQRNINLVKKIEPDIWKEFLNLCEICEYKLYGFDKYYGSDGERFKILFIKRAEEYLEWFNKKFRQIERTYIKELKHHRDILY